MKNDITKLDLIAGFQIFGGIIGLILQIVAIADSVLISLNLILFAILSLVLYSFSVFCGIQLVKNGITAVKYSLINQYLQVINFSLLGYGFEFVSGISVCIGINLTNSITTQYSIGFSTWHILLNGSTLLQEVNLNIIALSIIFFLKTRIIKEDRN